MSKGKIGLYGPHNMWFITSKLYEDYDIYAVTHDDNPEPPCKCVAYKFLSGPVPDEQLNGHQVEYEQKICTDMLKAMSKTDDLKIRTFNSISDDIELISYYYVKISGNVRHISDLSLRERGLIWQILWPNVMDVDINSNIALAIDDQDYVIAVPNCMVSKIVNNVNVFSPEERLDLILAQVKSIRAKWLNCKIFLLESALLPFNFLAKLSQVYDYVWLFDKDEVNQKFATANKTRGESYLQYNLFNRLKNFKLFIKFGAKYQTLHRFDINDFPLDKSSFRYVPGKYTWTKESALDAVFYTISYKDRELFLHMLTKILIDGPYIDIEHTLFKFFCPNNHLNNINILPKSNIIGYLASGMYNLV